MTSRPFAAATERNSQPILGVLRHEFEQVQTVLEIGSGTGQHAVCFAAALGHVSWQTSEMAEHHEGIRAWLNEASLPNVNEPINQLQLNGNSVEENSRNGTRVGFVSVNDTNIGKMLRGIPGDEITVCIDDDELHNRVRAIHQTCPNAGQRLS